MQAGLPYLDERIEMSDVGTDEIRRKLENARPAWKPGTASGYHAVTFGFILDELFKKVNHSVALMAYFRRALTHSREK